MNDWADAQSLDPNDHFGKPAAPDPRPSPTPGLPDEHWVWLGDDKHPDGQDYVAANLLAALDQAPNTGDWWGALRSWCEGHKTGKLEPLASPSVPAAGLSEGELEIIRDRRYSNEFLGNVVRANHG
jgi:hypothetical protein